MVQKQRLRFTLNPSKSKPHGQSTSIVYSFANDLVWCEYNGAYRGLLEQVLLPTITPKESLLDSDVTESSLYGREHKKLREYAEDNLKLKQFRRENFNEQRNGTAAFDHPKRVYDEFIKEDYVVTPKGNK